MTEDVDFRSIDKLLYFVLSLLSLKLKEIGISLGKFSDNVSQLLKCMPYSTRWVAKFAQTAETTQRCSNCWCYALQINFCLQLLNIDYKAMKRERGFLAFLPKRSIADVNARTSFPFFSFPDSHFVGSSSTARARGNIERNGLVELS